MKKVQKILVAPLDWGLGHSTRCVPLILQFLHEGHEVVLAAAGVGAAFLRKRFPQLTILDDIPSYEISYPANSRMVWHFMKQSRRLLSVIEAEFQWLQNKIVEFNIDIVYSDNRYGLHSEKIPCFLITHQLFLRVPFYIRFFVNRKILNYIKLYEKCLVPDFEGTSNLSGALSHGKNLPENLKYIGPLSRFSDLVGIVTPSKVVFHFVAIISGPEPQRTMLQSKLEEIFQSIARPSLIVCGQPDKQFDEQIGQIRRVSHLSDEELAGAILHCKTVVTRSGYSTLMDLYTLKKMAIIIPTPGQTEQEYLAEYHNKGGRHVRILQKDLTVKKIIQAHKRINYFNS